MPNIQVLRDAADAAEAFPEHTSQAMFAHPGPHYRSGDPGTFQFRPSAPEPPCGTTLCVAGWITWQEAPKDSLIDFKAELVRLADGRVLTIAAFAARAAGLSPPQEMALFVSSRTTGDVKAMIGYLEDHPGAGWHDLAFAAMRAAGADLVMAPPLPVGVDDYDDFWD